MKKGKKIGAVLLLFFFWSNFLCAQKTISEGTLTYMVTIKATGSDSILSSATVINYIKGGWSRTDMSSSLGKESTIYSGKIGNAVILKEYSGQKLMITLTKENWEAMNKKFNGLSFTYDDGGIKNINGYNCKKADTHLPDGSLLTVYFTVDINVLNKDYNLMFNSLPGIPVQYEVQNGRFSYEYKLLKVDLTPVSIAKFDFPRSGYRIMTYEENEQQRK